MAVGTPKKRLALFFAAIAIDMAVLAWFWHSLAHFRRPLDVLLVLALVLGAMTALASGKAVRSAMLILVSIALCLLAVELSQKFFNILGLAPRHSIAHGASGPYSWTSDDPHSYLAARKKAVEAGDFDPAMSGRHAGDVFARLGVEPDYRGIERSETRETFLDALKAPWLASSPNGYLMAPDNVIRHYLRLFSGPAVFLKP